MCRGDVGRRETHRASPLLFLHAVRPGDPQHGVRSAGSSSVLQRVPGSPPDRHAGAAGTAVRGIRRGTPRGVPNHRRGRPGTGLGNSRRNFALPNEGRKLPVDSGLLVTNRFRISIDGAPRGRFALCKGLAMSMEVEEFIEGGNNDSPVYLNTFIRYSPLTLTRLVSEGSVGRCKWVQESLANPDPKTGEIALMDANNNNVATWKLLDMRPIAWRGPILDASTGDAALEEIDFAHSGFYFDI
ncbi:phage tail protein [Streptomyces sp. NPDC002506]|uniref:phage tail protein n=1 Tax=Streptomyces sp. NPDC002506 TaxID=3154536 RepID=UPI00331CF93C